MIDSETGKRIVVQIDDKYGPFVRISTYADADALEDILNEQYFVLFWIKLPPELRESGGKEYYFGGAADPQKAQEILDSIDFG